MADNTLLNSGSGGNTFRTLEDGSSIQWPVGVTAYATTVGTPDVLQIVTTAAGLPIQIQTGASIPVTDNSGTLTVDAPVGTPVFVRLSDGSAAITTLPVSLASVPSHAVTNAGTFAVQAAQSGAWSVTDVSGTVSLPTGAATAAKQPALGTAGAASADVITIQGVASMTPLQVGDNSGSLTVDAPVGTPVFVRLSDGSAAISTLPVSLATVPSHAVTNAGTFATQPGPSASGGLSIFRSIDLDEGTLEVVKASAGQLYGGMVTNTATATRWIKFYDATSGTVGTGTPVITWGIPGNSTDDIGAVLNTGGMGVAFATGICVGASTGVADNDTGAPGANEVIVNLWYK